MPILSRSEVAHLAALAAIERRIVELKDQLAGDLDLDQTNRIRGAIGELHRIVTEAVEYDDPSPPTYS